MSRDALREEEPRPTDVDAEPAPSGPSPGKTTLTSRAGRRASADAIAVQFLSQLGLAPVQRTIADGSGDLPGGEAQAIAARGFGGGGGALPHLDRIQAAFGRHDVSSVRAHVGGAAAEASHDLGAHAYASGDQVAFAEAPDLFLVAHEAAHVVQQRGGVQLAGGVGAAGDAYEQHADEVAAAVVRGESAERLLDRHAGGGGGGGAGVQLMTADEARGVLRRLAGMPDAEQQRRIGGWSSRYSNELLAAISDEDRNTYREVIERIGTTRATSSEVWNRFATRFKQHFPTDVRAQFGGDAQITAQTMQPLFSTNQRDKLHGFFDNRHLPERLFNTGEGNLSVSQRRLMSAHMLTIGTFTRANLEEQRQRAVETRGQGEGLDNADQEPQQGGREQRVHARMCGHWVSLVNAYAGAGAANRLGTRENLDHDGNVVLNADTDTGAAPTTNGIVPMRDFHQFRAGDWLYIRTSINHSVMFAEWEGPQPPAEGEPITRQFYTAIIYDQGNPRDGGRRRPQRLGNRKESGITVVLRRASGSDQAQAATSPDQLIPQTAGRTADTSLEGLPQAYQQFLWERNLTLQEALGHVKGQNEAKIRHLEASRTARGTPRLDRTQADTLRRTNETGHLATLAHLNERLQTLTRATTAYDDGDRRRRARASEPSTEEPTSCDPDRQPQPPARGRGGQPEAPPPSYETTEGGVSQPNQAHPDAPADFDRGEGGATTGYLSRVHEPFRAPVAMAERGPRPAAPGARTRRAAAPRPDQGG
jgi:hypothetical protein